MKKIYNFIGAIGLFAAPFMANSQVNVNEDFNSGDPAGWILNGLSTGYDPGLSCDGSGQLADNFFGGVPVGDFTTLAYAANGGDIAVSFDYKVVDFFTDIGTVGDWGTLVLEYDVDGGGFLPLNTIDQSNHVVANTCANITANLTGIQVPAGSNVTFRMSVTRNNGDWDLYIDNFSAVEVTSCPAPSALAATSISGSGADLTWTDNAGAANFNIEYGIAGFTLGTGTQITSTGSPETISGLTPTTAYEFYVQADCGGGDVSAMTGPFAFTTPCATIALPWSEGFENAGSIPNCWTMAGGENWLFANSGFGHIGNVGTITGNTATDGYFAWVDASGTSAPATLTSPLIDISSLTVPQLTFYELSDNEGFNNSQLDVEVWDGSAWNPMETYNTNTNGWEEKVISLSSLTFTGPAQIRFTFSEPVPGDYYDDIAIDDVSFSESPTCPAPSDLTLVSADDMNANITWTTGGASQWIVEYGAVGFTPGNGTATPSLESSNSATITGLTPNSYYEAYVRDFCTVGDSSTWVGPLTFNTYNQGQFMVWDTDCGPGFNDISGTGTGTGLGDDDAVGVTMPFSFLYQGSFISDLTITNNGVIWLGDLAGDPFVFGPDISTSNDGLMPFGDDLDEESGDIYYETIGTAPNRTFIIQYEDRFGYDGDDPQTGITFQVAIEEATNEIYFFYQDVVFGQDLSFSDYGAQASIGAAGPNSDIILSEFDETFLQNNSCVHFFYANCPSPSNLLVTDVDNDTIVVTWNEDGNATAWEVNYGEPGFDPETGGTVSTSDDLTDTLDVLTQLTSYDIYVQSDCGSETSGWFGPVNQTTLPNCADPDPLSIFFVSQDTIEYIITDNAGALNWNVQYGAAGFEIGSGTTMSTVTTTDSIIDPALLGSTVYDIYVQADCLTPGDTSNWVGPVQVAMPIVNDSTCNAISLTVDGSINVFNNTGATPQINENTIEPPTDGYNTQTGWGESGTDLSTWFTFEAPASGIVEISTKDEDYNGQIAVYEAGDCSDFSTFTLLGANDDGYTAFFGGAELTLCGLTAGNTYYILHDNNDFTAAGNYSVSIKEVAVPEAGTADAMTICAGDGVDMNAQLVGAEADGVWTFVPTQDGSFITDDTTFVLSGLLALDTYSFQYTVNKRCAMDSVILDITTVGPSSAGEVTGTLDACFHTAVNLFDGLTGSVDLGGVWYNQLDEAQPNNTIAGNTIDVPGAYNYTYIVANEACPADTAEITVVYQDCLGLDEDQIGNIDVYPNPSNGVINIANNGNASEFTVTIQDVRGKVVYTNTPNLASGSVESIDLTSNNKGIYFVTLTSEGQPKK
jgi:hypothetical protein